MWNIRIYIPYKSFFPSAHVYKRQSRYIYRPNYTIENIHWNVLPCELGYICKGKCIHLFVKMHRFFLLHIFPTINPKCDEASYRFVPLLTDHSHRTFPPSTKVHPPGLRINRCPAYNIQMHAYYHPSTSNTGFSFPHLCFSNGKHLTTVVLNN